MDDAMLDQLHAMQRVQAQNTDGSYNVLLIFLTQDVEPFPTAQQMQFEVFLPQLNDAPFPCEFETSTDDNNNVCGTLTNFAIQALTEEVAALTATLIVAGARQADAQVLIDQELSSGEPAVEFAFNLLDDATVTGVSAIAIQPYRPRTKR